MEAKPTISVIGLGKLGSPMVACFAAKGYGVIGVDVNPVAIDKINAGVAPVQETGLAELISQNRHRIRATPNYEEAVANSDATFIIVPTPSDEEGKFSPKYAIAAAEQIGAALQHKDSFHLVVLTSTVMPGASTQEIIPVLEAKSGKRCGEHWGFCYSPEFIALGSVIRDMLNPDFVLIGESDSRSGEMLADIYRNLCDSNPSISQMNLVTAELAKISVNTFVTTKISYANMLGEICEKLPGADVDVLTSAIGQDTRIGKKYLKGATGYGGPCFPRDNIAFGVMARSLGAEPTIAEATDKVNSRQAGRIVSQLLPRLPENPTVGILGLSYKPGTNVIEESQGIALARELLEKNIAVVVYDPLGMNNTEKVLGNRPNYAKSVHECLEKADAIAIMNASPEFKTIEPEALTGKVVLDCWRLLEKEQLATVGEYIALGVGSTTAQ